MVMGSWRDHTEYWTTVRERDAPEHNILLTRIFDRRALNGARIPSLLSFGDTRGARQSKDNDERDIVSNADARQ
jgi:hypothetical protein